MFTNGIIQESDYQTALKTPVSTSGHKATASKSSYFVEHAKRELEKELGPSQLYKGGLNVYATLSYEMQTAAEDAVQKGLSALESRMMQHKVPVSSLQAALVALQVDSGAILAMVGGKNFPESSYNRTTLAKRQPGSAFKPIIYALAVENGFSQNHMVLDAPVAFRDSASQKTWQPENFSKTFSGEITFRKALANVKEHSGGPSDPDAWPVSGGSVCAQHGDCLIVVA